MYKCYPVDLIQLCTCHSWSMGPCVIIEKNNFSYGIGTSFVTICKIYLGRNVVLVCNIDCFPMLQKINVQGTAPFSKSGHKRLVNQQPSLGFIEGCCISLPPLHAALHRLGCVVMFLSLIAGNDVIQKCISF